MSRGNKKHQGRGRSIAERPVLGTTINQQPANKGRDFPLGSVSFMVFLYLIAPTVISGAMVAYYFYATGGFFFFAVIVGLWVVLRGFPTATKRWFERPIPTDRPYLHIFRLYFMLAFTLIPYLITFSFVYYGLGNRAPGVCTNIAMTKMSSLYYTTTIFTTTGFGDIYAVSNTCRAIVTVQMFSGFIIISIIIVVLVSRLLQLVESRRSDA